MGKKWQKHPHICQNSLRCFSGYHWDLAGTSPFFPCLPHILPFLAKISQSLGFFWPTMSAKTRALFSNFSTQFLNYLLAKQKYCFDGKFSTSSAHWILPTIRQAKQCIFQERRLFEGPNPRQGWLTLPSPALCPSQHCALLLASAPNESHLSREVSSLNLSWQVNSVIDVLCQVKGRCGWHLLTRGAMLCIPDLCWLVSGPLEASTSWQGRVGKWC